MVKLIYKRLIHRVAFHIFGANLSDAGLNSGFGLSLRGGPLLIRFHANMEARNPNVLHDPNARAVAEDAAPNAVNAAAHEDGPPDPALLAAAETILEKAASSFGRRVGGALLIPYISNVMGNLLFRISKHSHILREFLGIKQHRRLLNGLPPSMYPPVNSSFSIMNSTVMGEGLRKLGQMIKYAFRGTKAWQELEPVWWRNTVGLGLFVVVCHLLYFDHEYPFFIVLNFSAQVRDFLFITHLWLLKRELESRKVKSKDFTGINIAESNLVPSFSVPKPKQGLGAKIVSSAFGQNRCQS